MASSLGRRTHGPDRPGEPSPRDSFQNRVSGETEARFFYTHRPLPPKFKLLIPEPQPLNKL